MMIMFCMASAVLLGKVSMAQLLVRFAVWYVKGAGLTSCNTAAIKEATVQRVDHQTPPTNKRRSTLQPFST